MLPEIISKYLERYGAGEALLPPATERPLLTVTIPAHREEDLRMTVQSVSECLVPCPAEVLILINYSEDADQKTRKWHAKQAEYFRDNADNWNKPGLHFHFMDASLPSRHAGVGMARKILMDEALRRMGAAGVIVALDADCTVEPDYLLRIYEHFDRHPEMQGASVYFEHDLTADPDCASAIATYELHLRYYVEAQRFLKLPYAYHTVGSCMAVRGETYARTGGMNRRKAGEDFYFLQKIIPHGFGEINDTVVYPSARMSDRVPFGTGRAVTDLLSGNRIAVSYAPENIVKIREFIDYALGPGNRTGAHDKTLSNLADHLGLEAELNRIRSVSTTSATFRKHFFHWFDGFRLMKALHFLREKHMTDLPVEDAARWLLQNYHGLSGREDTVSLLKQYRSLQRFTSVP